MDSHALRSQLLAAFPEAEVQIEDTTGTGDHFAALIVAPAFEGKSLIERHRQVYAALGQAMRQEIHALALTTETPAERTNKT